jgi:ATP-dependent Clp protease ATP-binding subunit ClpA
MDFTDSYLVMTSNLGAREAMRSRTRNYTSFSNTVMEYVRRYLRPELLGRIEGIGSPFVFRRLEEPQQRELAGFHVERVLERMEMAGFSLTMGADAFEYVMRNGFSEEYGARRLLGVIRKSVEGAVSNALRTNQPTNGLLVERSDGCGLCIGRAAENAA